MALLIRTLKYLRRVPERMLHGTRRDAAERLVVERAIGSALFVCYGNICRSPFAALAFARGTSHRFPGVTVRVASAGFFGPGRSSPEQALAAAMRRGYDLSPHQSQLVSPDLVATSDLIVVMSAEQASGIRARHRAARLLVLGDLDPEPVRERTIPDPWGHPQQVFEESYDRILRCVGELVRLMSVPGAGR